MTCILADHTISDEMERQTGEGRKVCFLWGRRLRFYREAANLSQADLETRSGIEREYISGMELGRIGVPSPDNFNLLHDALGFPGFELLEAIGYKTDAPGIEGVDPGLAAFICKLTPGQQLQTLEILKSAWKFGFGSSSEPTIF